MSRKESFSVEKPKSRSSEHNNRTDKPKYLIEPNQNFNGNFYKRYNYYENDKQYKMYAQDLYKEKIGQSMQEIQKPAIIKEVIVTLKKEHDEHTVLKLFAHLEEKYGGHQILELAIHHDEGHFEDVEGLTYYPNNDIFYNVEDEKWYLDKSFQEPVPKNLKKIYNYHAHVKFTMMDKATAKTPQMPKKLFSQRHKVVADFLGLRYAPGKSRFHKKDIAQIKEEHSENRHKQKIRVLENKKLKETIAELNQHLIKRKKVPIADLEKLKEEFRKEMISSELFFKKEDYQALNKLFEDAKSDNLTMELSLTKLQGEIASLKVNKTKYHTKTKELEVDIKTFKYSDLNGYKDGIKTGNKLTYKRLVVLRDKKIEILNKENKLLKEELCTSSEKKEELSETITILKELSYFKKQETGNEGDICDTYSKLQR